MLLAFKPVFCDNLYHLSTYKSLLRNLIFHQLYHGDPSTDRWWKINKKKKP